MAKKIKRKLRPDVRAWGDKPAEPVNPIPGLRVFSKEEFAERQQARREGKLRDPEMELSSRDARRKRQRRNVTLPEDAMRIARKLGRGNASWGIEIALTHAAKCKRDLT